jgi:predicted amino acid racemase
MSLNLDLVFNRKRLSENIHYLNEFFRKHEMKWTFVIKAFSGYSHEFIKELSDIPCSSIASDNENHLKLIKSLNPSIETWFLNYSAKVVTSDFIDVDLTHSEQFVPNKSCLMLTIDPERHGIEFRPNFECNMFGAYLDCSKHPSSDFFDAWSRLNISPEKIQSLGTSVSFESIDFLKSKGVNHFRLGEIVLTGRSLINGSRIKGFRDDVFSNKKNVSYHMISHFNF